MKFGTRHDRSPYRSGSITTVARDFARHKLDLVGVQELMWGKGGTVRAKNYFFYEKGNENHQLKTYFFVHYRIVSTGTRVAFVSDRTSERLMV
jgi:hypothetical protein